MAQHIISGPYPYNIYVVRQFAYVTVHKEKKKDKMRQCNFLSQNNTPNFNLKQQIFYHTHIIHNGLKNEPKKPKPPLHGLIEKTSLKTVALLYQVG